MNTFKGKPLCIIDDFSREERLYLFSKVRLLKDAIANDDKKTIDGFRINDPDFGIYEVFLEDSTRTKESFRNAANFHHAKLTEMSADNSSFNKGESYADTFNTLCGYNNRIFIIRSRIEDVCKYLSQESPSERTSCAIGYDTPDNYYRRFMKGEIEHRNTFENRILSEIPKGRKNHNKSTSGNENEEKHSVESTLENEIIF